MLKTISFLALLVPLSSVSAGVHKCIVNGNITYQQTRCTKIEETYTAPKDISLEQQAAATEKRIANLTTAAEEKKSELKASEAARRLHLEAEKIRAIKLQTQAISRQATALEEQNNQLKKNTDNTYLGLPTQIPSNPPQKNNRDSPSKTNFPVTKSPTSQEHSLNLPTSEIKSTPPVFPTKNHSIRPE